MKFVTDNFLAWLASRAVGALQVCPLLITTLCLGGCASTLERAVSANDIAEVQRQIAKGANVNGKYWTSWKYPIVRAAENNNLDALVALHKGGATLHAGLLVVAAEHGSGAVYPYLVEQGVPLGDCYFASSLQRIFPKESDVFADLPILPPIGVAIVRRDLDSVKQLVELGSPLVVPCNPNYSFSAILAATLAGDPEIAEYLIARGANPNTLRTDGMTPLAIAAQNGDLEAARVLLASGAFHTYMPATKQPIELAAEKGHQNIVELLQHAGAVPPERPVESVRPQFTTRIQEVAADVAVIAVGAIVIAGAIWAITEAAEHTDYPVSLTPSTPQPDADVSHVTDAICRNDYDCPGFFMVCLKQSYKSEGTCVKDASGKGDSPDSYGPRTPPIGTPEATACPAGYRYDTKYRTCIR